MEYRIELKIEANNETELAEKLQAFTDINEILEHKDFVNVIEIIKEKPVIVQLVKEIEKELNGKEMNEISILDGGKIVMKIIKKLKDYENNEESNNAL
ncbi:MAG: hypothetical protein JXR68_12770 [Bacteroidales bacterium]|nr:hypothetical protein [Bacteroidales bacterium]